MGEEGFSSDSSLLYHRERPLGDRRQPGSGSCPTAPRAEPAAAAPSPAVAAAPASGGARPGHRTAAGAGQRRRADLLRRRAGPHRCTATPSATSACTSSRAGDRRDRVRVVSRPAPATTWCSPSTTHRWLPTAASRRLYASRRTATSPRPGGTCRASASCSSTRPTASATCTGPGSRWSGGRRRGGVHQAPRVGPSGGIAGTGAPMPAPPFDVVGWDGCLYPYTFNVEDFMPITGKVHQPPPVHQVFEGANFVVCNFCPRKVDYHPQSIPVPYYHSNVDSDEVMFYSAATTRPARARASAWARSRCTRAAIRTAPSRARSRPDRGRVLRRARRHGRHLPSARARRGRARGRGPGAYAWTWAGRGPGDGPAVFSNS